MPNVKKFVCKNCNYSSAKWQGKCPECGEWSTLEEQVVNVVKASKKRFGLSVAGTPIAISEVTTLKEERASTGLVELDEVLGGGLVAGSLVLLGGDPGIGKSTLALQAAVNMSALGKTVLYVSGEESSYQIKMRAERLSAKSDLLVLTETNLESIIAALSSNKYDVVVIDSIQTLYSEEVNGVTGGVSQIVYSTNSLMRFAKSSHTAIIIIGHVTKEGTLAGPKTLEHMVDAVMYLEGERFGTMRLLRSIKNRFGGVGEVGVFEMTGGGLREIMNASSIFLDEASLGKPGSSVACIVEGNKALLVEVQALVSKASFNYPKRTTSGFDNNRLQLIVAILEKHMKAPLSNYDIYVNVAGGFKLEERAADLPVALAILSSLKETAIARGIAAFGELGLSGEVRGVQHLEKRLKECEKLGFKKVLVGGRKEVKDGSFKKLVVTNISFVGDLNLEIKK